MASSAAQPQSTSPTGGAADADFLHSRQFVLEIQEDGRWQRVGILAVQPAGATLDGVQLEDVRYAAATGTLSFASYEFDLVRAGFLLCDETVEAFSGSLVTTPLDGQDMAAPAIQILRATPAPPDAAQNLTASPITVQVSAIDAGATSATAPPPVFASARRQTMSLSLLHAMDSMFREALDERDAQGRKTGSQVFVGVDRANRLAQTYFNRLAINQVSKRLGEQLFGGVQYLPSTIQAIGERHKAFLKEKASAILGAAMVKSPKIMEVRAKTFAKVKRVELERAGEAVTQDPRFMPLYLELYRACYVETLPEFNAYLQDGKRWADAYHGFVTDPHILAGIVAGARLDSATAVNAVQQITTKLSLLDPSGKLAEDATLTISALLMAEQATYYNDAKEMNVDELARLVGVFAKLTKAEVANEKSGREGELGWALIEKLQSHLHQAGITSSADYGAFAVEVGKTMHKIYGEAKKVGQTGSAATVLKEAARLQAAVEETTLLKRLAECAGNAWGVMSNYLSALTGAFGIASITYQVITDTSMTADRYVGAAVGGAMSIFGTLKSFTTVFFRSQLRALFDQGAQLAQGYLQRLGLWIARDIRAVGGVANRMFGSAANLLRTLGAVAAWLAVAVQIPLLIKTFEEGSVRDKALETIKTVALTLGAVSATLNVFSNAMFLSLSFGSWGAIFAVAVLVVLLVQTVWEMVDPQKASDGIDDFVMTDLRQAGFASA